MRFYVPKFFLLVVGFVLLLSSTIPNVSASDLVKTEKLYVYEENKKELSDLQSILADTIQVKKVGDRYAVDVEFPNSKDIKDFVVAGADIEVKQSVDGGKKVYTVWTNNLSDIYTATITLENGESERVQLQFGGKQNPFTDIQQLANYDKIVSLYSKGIFKESEQFNPDSSTTRYQFALMLYRALNLEVDTSKATNFKDVEDLDSEAIAAINALNAAGIIKGVDQDTFAPNEKIKRSQAARMIYRVLEMSGYQADSNAEMPFVDVPEADTELVTALAQLNKLGIMTGYEGKLNPSSPLTRDQMAKVLFTSLEVEEVKVSVSSQDTNTQNTDEKNTDTDTESTDESISNTPVVTVIESSDAPIIYNSTEVTDTTKKYAILVVAGQSNAVGYDESPESNHQLYQPNDRIKQLGIYDNENLQIIPLTAYAQNFQDMRKVKFTNGKGTKGIHLPLANLILPHLPNDYELIVISAAYGGTGFTTGSDGKYDEKNKKPAVDGIYKWGVNSPYYKAMVDRIEHVLNLNSANKYIGTVWIQGEADGGNPTLHKEKFEEMTNNFFTHFKQKYSDRVLNGQDWGKNQWFNVFTVPYWYQKHPEKQGIIKIWKNSYQAWNESTYVDFSFGKDSTIYTNETKGTGGTSDTKASHYGNDAYATLVAPNVYDKMLEVGAIKLVTQ